MKTSELLRLPSVFQKVLQSQELNWSVFEEKATCQECLYGKDPGASPLHVDLKCCGFQPFFANFLIGDQLLQEGPLAAGTWVTELQGPNAFPIGLFPSPDYQKRFQESRWATNLELLCLAYDQENKKCGIWQFRPAPCASFFCQSSYGAEGLKFWNAMESLLLLIESQLAFQCLLEFGWTNDDCQWRQMPPSLPESPWFEWQDRRLDFYKKCAIRIGSMNGFEIWNLLGHEGDSLAFELRNLAEQLPFGLPPKLC